MNQSADKTIWKKYNYTWVTLGLFLFSMLGHWIFGWFSYVDDQLAHQEPVEISRYSIEMLRDTFENWQSEFLQLIWQVAGLAFLFHGGSPQSKEGDERMEEKVDAILKSIDPENGMDIIRQLDQTYMRDK